MDVEFYQKLFFFFFHHWLNGHEFEQTPGIGDGQGSLTCCSPWGRKESDTTEQLTWTDLDDLVDFILQFVNVMYHIDWFADTEKSLHPWDKSHLIMVYDFYGITDSWIPPPNNFIRISEGVVQAFFFQASLDDSNIQPKLRTTDTALVSSMLSVQMFVFFFFN